MRKTLMASATLLALASSLPAFAQAPTPPGTSTDQAPPAATVPDASEATPSKPRHHHLVNKISDSDSTTTWAHQPGTGESGPASSSASNIDQSDSHSSIAPHFPQPKAGENASPEAYLRDAQAALAKRHTGEAQQALEMAETRLLDRSTAPDAASMPDQSPEIRQVSQARAALGHSDMAGARSAIQMALANAPAPSAGQMSPMSPAQTK